ncbi:type II toxin-antitoxin system PemK/MazF family toxin [Paenibacillus faecalis]|uniref:type II toxin-antitoxin system PemK/MazF family toxin n=1 Tax=Paenibacillus faecalis TaxID=2079532 RepID=UPI000D0E4EEA|nr:type II toxin-antitoxin system PemK/MazF family toxin [Paenibacillus faecalis]
MSEVSVKQFDIWLANLGDSKGSVQRGVRPVIVISNDKSNKYAPIAMVAPITSSLTKRKLPTHVHISAREIGCPKDSVVLFEQHITIDKSQLIHKIIDMPKFYEHQFERALNVSTSRFFS